MITEEYISPPYKQKNNVYYLIGKLGLSTASYPHLGKWIYEDHLTLFLGHLGCYLLVSVAATIDTLSTDWAAWHSVSGIRHTFFNGTIPMEPSCSY